ncbi:MAG: hypothetical protein AAFS07_07610 [Pseudomonadota bacterium]
MTARSIRCGRRLAPLLLMLVPLVAFAPTPALALPTAPAPEVSTDGACEAPQDRCTWERTFGAGTEDKARGAATHAGGEITVVGTTRSPAGLAYAAWVLRLARDGTPIWRREITGEAGENRRGAFKLTDVAPAPQGGLVAVGDHRVPGGRGSDLRILRYDADGGVLGDRTLGGAGNDRIFSVSAMPRAPNAASASGFWAAGYTDTPTQGAATADQDLWVVRLASDGSVLAERRFGGGGGDAGALDIAGLPDGGALVGGYRAAAEGRGLDAWVLRLDRRGEIRWERRFDRARFEAATAVTLLPGGDIAVVGMVGVEDKLSEDLWITRLSRDGTLLWHRRMGGSGRERPSAVTPLAGGGLAIAAIRWFEPEDAGDAWLIGMDPDGATRWERRFGGPLWDRPTGLVPLEGGLLMVGHTSSIGAGFEDAWLLRLDAEGRF